eukprot:comp23588_c0_seq1/m.40019 comp23588_c0_seq1/g.40019  ORF comp23588_c0_seq1/g.40019 comp23588_c0_seq1/m.40019 type:complete len:426 (-) comp23588_c0_seq1:24-1301(-)
MRCTAVLATALSVFGAAQAGKDTFAVLHAPRSVEYESNVRQHSAVEVADFLAQSLGLPSYRRSTTKLANVQPLSLPKASVLFVLDEAPVDGKDFSDAVVMREVASSSSDDLSTVVTMLTGSLEPSHGILGRKWLADDGEETSAYSTPSHSSLAGNLGDYLRQLFAQTTTVSVSSDRQMALAAAPRNGENSLVYAWDNEAQSFVSLGGKSNSQLALTRDTILNEAGPFIQSTLPPASYSADTHTITIGGATLDLNKEADFLLVSELLAIHRALSVAQTNAAAATHSHPDFLAFVLVGPKLINGAYGVDSLQAKAAGQLVNAFVAQAGSQASLAYRGQAVVSVVALQPRNSFVLPLRRRRDVVSNNSTNDDASWYTPTFPVTFHIILWLVVALIVAVWMAVYACMTMDPGYDSVIYRTTGGARQKAD